MATLTIYVTYLDHLKTLNNHQHLHSKYKLQVLFLYLMFVPSVCKGFLFHLTQPHHLCPLLAD